MNKIISLLMSTFTLLFLSGLIFPYTTNAQYTFFHPTGCFAIEASLENPPDGLIRLPIYRNSISSLTITDDIIVGGTRADEGLAPYLFLASISKRSMTGVLDLEQVLPGQRSIQSGFYKGTDKVLYAGTIANGNGKSGHIIGVKVAGDKQISVTDLGIPVEGEGIYALTGNPGGSELYGITYPTGKFFTFNVNTRKTEIYSDIAVTKKDLDRYNTFALQPEDYLSRSLVTDNKGRVYGSAPVNRLFYFEPVSKKIIFLKDPIPFVWGRDVLGRVDSWARSENGTLYGGNGGDGQLFSVNPQTGKVTNLGKPIMMNRLPAIAFGKDKKLYGIAGASPGYAHLFSYQANTGFHDLGNPQFEMKAPGIEQGIDWRSFRIGTMVASEDGQFVVMGEDEALSQLMVFPVYNK